MGLFPLQDCKWTRFRLAGFRRRRGSHLRRDVLSGTEKNPFDHGGRISGSNAVSSGWKEGVPELVLAARGGRRSSRTSNVLGERIGFEVVGGIELNRQRVH